MPNKIQSHLQDDAQNIIIFFEHYPLFCNKNDFILPTVNNIYSKCIYKNKNTLNFSEMLNSENEYIEVDYKSLIKRNHLKGLFEGKDRIFNMKVIKSDKFIVKEELQKLLNISYDTDQDYLLKRSVLYDYSFGWDYAINSFLRKGDAFFKDPYYIENFERFLNPTGGQDSSSYGSPSVKDVETAKVHIEKHIYEIDKCFFLYAPLNNSEDFYVYRGMRGEYIDEMKVGDIFEIPNYISTTTNIKIASNYSGHFCCLYYFTLDAGIPYIDMVLWETTHYKNEKEILLPRNLIAKCVKIFDFVDYFFENNIPSFMTGIYKNIESVYHIHLSKKYDDQFDRKNTCNTYNIVTLEPKQLVYEESTSPVYEPTPSSYSPMNNSLSDDEDNPSSSYRKINNSISSKIKKNSRKSKKSRKTGLSEKINKLSLKKRSRCPNGFRKSRKTGLCELKM